MSLKTILIDNKQFYPVQIFENDAVTILLFDGPASELIDDFENQQATMSITVDELTCEQLNIAVYNYNFICFRDMINVMQLDTQGIVWKVSPEDELLVVDGQTNEDVLRAVNGPFASNNATVAATAKDALAALIGVYYRIHNQGDLSCERVSDRMILNYILQIMRKAGVKNVHDFEYP
jgi:hypothetical protein